MVNVTDLRKSYNRHIKSEYSYSLFSKFIKGTCLMSSKSKNYFVFTTSLYNANLIYIKNNEFLTNYINFVQKATNTIIEYKIIKNEITFVIKIDKLKEPSSSSSVYRAMVLVRLLIIKYYYIFPIAIMELQKYTDSIEEILYLAPFTFPHVAYYGIHNGFKSSVYDDKFTVGDPKIIIKFIRPLITDNRFVFNDYFYPHEDYNVYVENLEIKEKIFTLFKSGLFKEGYECYVKLKKENEL
jgi:hypothetical protein